VNRFVRYRALPAAALIAGLVATGCGGGGKAAKGPARAASPAVSTSQPAVGENVSTVATAKVASVGIYDSAGQPEPSRSLANPVADGSTLVFLVTESRPDWLKVLLPARPNGSTGWIRAAEVSTATHDYRIEVEVGAHHLTVWKGNDVFLEDTVAVGASATPTALGTFYTTGLFETGSTQPVYGPYAYPLSGYSEVLFTFGSGDGQMGLHGTNDPSSLGHSVSNGCIRMSNSAITKLAQALPVGVPVDVKA